MCLFEGRRRRPAPFFGARKTDRSTFPVGQKVCLKIVVSPVQYNRISSISRLIRGYGIHLSREAAVLVARSGEHVLSWHLARSETSRAYAGSLRGIAPPEMVDTTAARGSAPAAGTWNARSRPPRYRSRCRRTTTSTSCATRTGRPPKTPPSHANGAAGWSGRSSIMKYAIPSRRISARHIFVL